MSRLHPITRVKMWAWEQTDPIASLPHRIAKAEALAAWAMNTNLAEDAVIKASVDAIKREPSLFRRAWDDHKKARIDAHTHATPDAPPHLAGATAGGVGDIALPAKS